MNSDQIGKLLRSTPQLLTAWLKSLPGHLLLKAEKKEAWHSLDIVKHLIYGEHTDWIPRLRLMIKENRKGKIPTFEPFDRNGHKQIESTAIDELLEMFEQIREYNVEELHQLSHIANLDQLKGVHPALGNITGKELLSTWVVHDQTHIYQIARNITSIYADQVGPWSAYLKIVSQNDYDEK